MSVRLPGCAKRLLETANRDTAKGDYRVYNVYHQELNTMELSPAEYQEAVKRLADALRV